MGETFPVKILPPRVHLTHEDCEAILGREKTEQLEAQGTKTYRDTGEFVSLTGTAGEMKRVPVFLPFQDGRSLVMLTLSGARSLGLKAPVCIEPVDCASPGVTVSGTGSVSLSNGVHIPRRRLLLWPKSSIDPHLREGDMAFVAPVISKMKPKAEGTRVSIFGEV